jgi:hypothetical protein
MLKNQVLKVLMAVIVIALSNSESFAQNHIINFIFTSDAHFGITRAQFRGDTSVAGVKVNAAMIGQMNSLPGLELPNDNGVSSGKEVGAIDYLVEGGDIANRQEIPIQNSARSWAQFEQDYMHLLDLKGRDGQPVKLLIVPGNHDISNAIGFAKPMKPLTDPTSMVNIYNLMVKPAKPLTNDDFDYAKDKVNYSRDIGGIHFVFITLWPDSAERIWINKNLATVSKQTPVVIVTHDQPESESKHFTNPLPPHNMTLANRFENLTPEYYKEGMVASKDEAATAIEQRGFVKFLKAHPNIKAYFHGNSNWNEFYVYHGPDNDVNLDVFRVDSPMKGKYSAKDETKLSFQLISLDPVSQTLTVRECLWNTKPNDPNQKVVFGESKTVSIKVSKS